MNTRLDPRHRLRPRRARPFAVRQRFVLPKPSGGFARGPNVEGGLGAPVEAITAAAIPQITQMGKTRNMRELVYRSVITLDCFCLYGCFS